MTLLELFNLSVTLFMFPNNDGQPGIFPTPSFGDYLEDWAHYLRTHMPYADDLYQRGIRKFLVVELFVIYFYLMLILRRFRLAQIYLLVKVITFALLFLTSGASYWNFLAWPLCFIVYPLEVLVVFMLCALFLHRHALPKLKNKKGGVYKVYKDIKVLRFRKDGSTYWEECKEFYAMRGIFTPDRMYYHLGIFALYSLAKYKMILGNPLATFYRFWSTDSALESDYYVSGRTYDPEFGFLTGKTTKMMERLYLFIGDKYPLVKEMRRRADAADIKLGEFSKKTTLEKQHDTLLEILELPTYTLFGFRFPGVVEQQRFEAKNASRWLLPPYKWVPVYTERPNEIDEFFEEKDLPIELQIYRNFINTKMAPKKSTVERIPAPKPMHTLAQRIIDNLTTDHFNATKEAVLNPDTKLYTSLTDTTKNSTVGRLPYPRWRYRAKRKSFEVAQELTKPDERGRYWIFTYRNLNEAGYGWTQVRPAKRVKQWGFRSHLYSKPIPRPLYCGESRPKLGLWKKVERVGHRRRFLRWTPAEKAWQKEYEQPEVRTGFTGFNFEQFAPLMELDSISNLRYGLLFILALSSLTVYSIILAGWSSNSKYAFLGALRSAAQMISYEVSISLALLPVILLSGALNLTAIVYGQIGTVWYLFPLLPIALVFLVSMLAETNRTPFDLPEAEAELVAGYNVDYSALPFAMFFLGEYSNMILISVLFCLLFLGGWDGAVVALQEPYVLTFKAAFVWIFFVIVRATLPRYRYDQLMDIGWKAFLPFAGSFLVFVLGLVIFLGVAPVVEEVALEDLYGAPASFLLELDPSFPSTAPSAPQAPAAAVIETARSIPSVVPPASQAPMSWRAVFGYTSLAIGFILATGGLGAAIAAGGGTAGMAGIGGVVGIASAGGTGGTAVAVLTSTTPTALMVKLSILLGAGYSVWATQGMDEGVAVVTTDAVEFNRLLVESDMTEYCRRLLLKLSGVNPDNIPPNFQIWFQYSREATHINCGHYNRFGIFKIDKVLTAALKDDTQRRITWVYMKLLGLEAPEELLYGF